MPADRELTERLAARDPSALAELYDRLGARAYGLALAILGEGADAEEAVSDAFLQVWEQAASYSSERGSLEAWLLTVVRSRALDRLRTHRRRARLLADAEHRVASLTLADPGPDEEAAGLARIVVDDVVARALRDLPVEQRRIIELAHLGGMTHSEIAEELGVPLGTVKTRLRSGMGALRTALAPVADASPGGGL